MITVGIIKPDEDEFKKSILSFIVNLLSYFIFAFFSFSTTVEVKSYW